MDGLKNRVCFREGDVIFSQGDDGSEAYYIESGHVEISHDYGDGKVFSEVLGAGAIFGEMAILSEEKRLMTVKVIETAQCYSIPRKYMDQQISSASPFIRVLLRVVTNTVQRSLG